VEDRSSAEVRAVFNAGKSPENAAGGAEADVDELCALLAGLRTDAVRADELLQHVYVWLVNVAVPDPDPAFTSWPHAQLR
jgi:hypothetical protein